MHEISVIYGVFSSTLHRFCQKLTEVKYPFNGIEYKLGLPVKKVLEWVLHVQIINSSALPFQYHAEVKFQSRN